MTNGGEGVAGFECSEETRRKIGDAHRGRKHSAEICRKRGEALRGKLLGRKHSVETLQKMSEAHRGRRHSAKSLQKISEAKRGKKRAQGECSFGHERRIRNLHGITENINISFITAPQAATLASPWRRNFSYQDW